MKPLVGVIPLVEYLFLLLADLVLYWKVLVNDIRLVIVLCSRWDDGANINANEGSSKHYFNVALFPLRKASVSSKSYCAKMKPF